VWVGFDGIQGDAAGIYGVHVADRREPDRGDLDRALPGEGVIRLGPMLRALDESGHDGSHGLEHMADDGTFGDRHPDSLRDLPAGVAASRAVADVRQVWGAR
jgi:sugar phosphate isomerase/epimerase